MRFWFDTEFIEDGKTIDLMSIGVIAADGRTFYAECEECDLSRASPWVVENVLPHLNGLKTPRAEIAQLLVRFMGPKPEIWAYYADYDWVALCQLFGTMMQLPDSWPMYCRDVKQLCDALGNPPLPRQEAPEHNALADAAWCAEAWRFLTNGLGAQAESQSAPSTDRPPDLYAALKAMVDRWEPDCIGTDRVMWENARAALAKARGDASADRPAP